MAYSGAGEKLFHEKNLKSKISWHCYFNLPEPQEESHPASDLSNK
jgi:hypothetical protein